MTDKEALIERLATTCLGLDAVDPLRLLVDDVVAALAQPHETTLKEFNQFIHDDPNYHIWAKKREAKVEGSLHVVCQCDKCKAHPPQRTEQEQQIETLKRCLFQMQEAAKSLTSPPRTWVGLTNEEIADEFYRFESAGAWYQFTRAVEAKLKQKNGFAEEKNAICSPFMISELWRLQK
jgi:hypothetical protein